MTTPIRRQYLDLKRRHPGTILFFRLGDFYETFDEDAELVARELDIVLTSKPMGKGIRVPLAGVPHQSIDGHVSKLVRRGHRVAICEQMADPASVKGLVPREVVRTVTAGTVTSEAALSAEAPNELAALVERGGEVALALAEVTTGEVRVASGEGAVAELARAAPAELLVEEEGAGGGVASCEVERPHLSAAVASALVAEQYGESAPETLVGSEAAVAAVAQVLAYLGEVYPEGAGALGRVRTLASEETVALDGRTLTNLEALPAGDGRPSLFAVLNRTRSAMGARLLRRWLAQPLRRGERAGGAARRARVGAGASDRAGARADDPSGHSRRRAALRAAGRTGGVAQRAGGTASGAAGSAGPGGAAGEVGAVSATGVGAGGAGGGGRAAAGAGRGAGGRPAAELRGRRRDRPRARRGDRHAAGADTLGAGGAAGARGGASAERTGIRTLKVGQNRVFGYYLEVSLANAELVPERFQRRQTLVGAERYVTEELKELESGMTTLRERLAAREREAFEALVEKLGAQLEALQRAGEGLATIDVALGLAEAAAERGYVRPEFSDGSRLAIRGGRHAVVEAALGPGRFVPNDCVLEGKARILLLTGPNMSGKSTYLRQVALIALMAQAGSFVPAEVAELPLFDRIFTRIGAHDDLAAGHSTFMVEMVETAQILHRATDRSLVILDEVGRGTSTFDGMAIARAVLEFLDARPEGPPRTLFATHYHELTAVADELATADNAHVAVHDEGGEVVFEHRIEPGPSDRSYGIHVARLAGLPASVVERARTLLDELEGAPAAQPVEGGERAPAAAVMQGALFGGGDSEVEAELAELDLEAMTPLEAMTKLGELRERARGAE